MEKKSEMNREEVKSLLRKILIRFSLFPIALGLLILVPAWTFNYWQVYAYFALILVPMILVLFYFLKRDPKFLERRTRMREKEKQQGFITILSSLVFLLGFIIPGLDHRFHWSEVPLLGIIIAYIIILFGYLVIFLVFKQNSYASRIIEVEEDQEVITSGMYAFVRHPMYIGVLLMYIPTPVALGSYWGLLPFALLPFVLVLRIINEEKVLRKELKGYEEYCQKTKYRLIPYIW